jgi:DNA (cytosine-5)-methyltransferase 1
MAVHGTQDPDTLTDLAHTLGRNQGQENAVIAFSSKDYGGDATEELSPTLRAAGHSESHANAGAPPAIAYGIPGNWIGRAPENGGNATEPMVDIAPCLTVTDRHGVVYAFQPRIARNGRGDMGDIVHSLNAQSGETGKGDSAPCVAVAFAENSRAEVRLEGGDGQITGALSVGGGKPGQGYPAVVAFQERGRADGRTLEINGDLAYTLTAPSGGGRAQERNIADFRNMSVRRLTPVECERLQGFPDNHTLIPVEKRKQITADEYAYLRHHFPKMTAEEAYRLAADGPRYKAIGNSMAVPVMRWIGARILFQLSRAPQ